MNGGECWMSVIIADRISSSKVSFGELQIKVVTENIEKYIKTFLPAVPK